MKILVLGINFAPEIISTGPYTTSMTDWLAEAGDEVRVVTAQPYYPAWKVFDGWPRFGWKRQIRASGVRAVHCPHYVPAKPSGAKRILHHLTFALTSLPVLLWQAVRFRPDMVMVVAPALVSAPGGWLAARLSGAKCWLHVQDFEVDAAFATGLLPATGFFARLARGFDGWIHRRFDRVSSISAPMLAKFPEKGIPAERIVELRNWANLAKVSVLPEGASPFFAEFGLQGRQVALYSGNIANKQGLELIPAAARALAHREDLVFAICGDGPFLPELKRLSEGLPNIRFFPLQPIDRLGDLLGMASVHLLPQIAGVADSVLPSKLTNMLASGRPTVATAAPGTALAAAVEGAGLVTPPGDAAAMAAAIGRLLDDPGARAELGRAAREKALDQWDSARILTRFRQAALQLCGVSLSDTSASGRIRGTRT